MKITKYTAIILFSILVSACFQEPIDLDLNAENPKLVITGWITDLDEPQYINVSRTVNYLGDYPVDYVTGAEVTLSDSQASYSLIDSDSGFYYLPDTWMARVGDLYTLRVNYGGEEYTATHIMNPCPEIDSLSFMVYESDDPFSEDVFDPPLYETVFNFQEPQGLGDAYYFVDYLKGTTEGDSVVNGSYEHDQFLDGIYVRDIRVSRLEGLYALGDTAVVEMYSIGRKTADYLYEVEEEIDDSGPFGAPPANVSTNISNGGVGYFIASGAHREEIVIQFEEEEE